MKVNFGGKRKIFLYGNRYFRTWVAMKPENTVAGGPEDETTTQILQNALHCSGASKHNIYIHARFVIYISRFLWNFQVGSVP